MRLHPCELWQACRNDGLPGCEVLEGLQREAALRVRVREIRDDRDVESRDVARKVLVRNRAQPVDVLVRDDPIDGRSGGVGVGTDEHNRPLGPTSRERLE